MVPFPSAGCQGDCHPRMHGIRHSIVREETGLQLGTIFSWPDYFHGTVRLNVPQGEITIGVPAFQNPQAYPAGLWCP